jgi:hypothetical protein
MTDGRVWKGMSSCNDISPELLPVWKGLTQIENALASQRILILPSFESKNLGRSALLLGVELAPKFQPSLSGIKPLAVEQVVGEGVPNALPQRVADFGILGFLDSLLGESGCLL